MRRTVLQLVMVGFPVECEVQTIMLMLRHRMTMRIVVGKFAAVRSTIQILDMSSVILSRLIVSCVILSSSKVTTERSTTQINRHVRSGRRCIEYGQHS